MATVAEAVAARAPRHDHLSGTPRAGAVDRWIYVFTAATMILIVLAGFIPDSLEKIAAVEAGTRPPFPLVMHLHALLMGAFLLLLLTQTILVATGKCAFHRRLGITAFLLVPALVVVGVLLAANRYGAAWDALQAAAPAARAEMQQIVFRMDNILLMQLRIGILFSLFLLIGLRARGRDAGFHKRMMILATAVTLPAAIDRITWLPNTFPASPLGTDLYVMAAVAPMFVWDVMRNRSVHPAYLLWIAVYGAAAVAVHALWDSPWWQAAAPRLMGV